MQLATVRDLSKGKASNSRAAVKISDDHSGSDAANTWRLLDAANLNELFRDPNWRDEIESTEQTGSKLTGPKLTGPELTGPKLNGQQQSNTVSANDLEFLNPLPSPQKVICCGLNYRDHILETGRELPKFPTLFAKFADTLTDPTAEIRVQGSEKVDWEAELAIVVGAHLQRASKEEAANGILGYTIANDVSMRDWQHRTLQWLQGKAFDRTTPVGPVVVTRDELDPKSGLEVTCSINGKQTQHGNTRELVFDAADLVSYISTFTTLNPGDLILTGTPGGIGGAMNPPTFLNDGDELVTAIEGIGELRNVFRIQSD